MFATKRNNLEALIVRGIDLTIEFATLGEYGIHGYIGDLPDEPEAAPARTPQLSARPARMARRPVTRELQPATAAARAAFELRAERDCAEKAARTPGAARRRLPRGKTRRDTTPARPQPCISPTTGKR